MTEKYKTQNGDIVGVDDMEETEGMIIGDQFGVIFREHHSEDPSNFADHTIIHPDLFVIIQDVDAYCYTREDGSSYIDVGPDTLGLEKIDEDKIVLVGKEQHNYDLFLDGHVCPGLDTIFRIKVSAKLTQDNTNGIGTTTWIECSACGTKQNITDYNKW